MGNIYHKKYESLSVEGRMCIYYHGRGNKKKASSVRKQNELHRYFGFNG